MENIKELARLLAVTSNEEEIEEFLVSIFTPAELRTLSSRWELVKFLEQGISQRTIARQLGLSLCKITRGSRELKKENSILKKMIAQIDN